MRSKRGKEIAKIIDTKKKYSIEEALEELKKTPNLKFDESIDFSLKIGVDPKKSDQQVRGTVSLPHGTGKSIRVCALCKGEHAKDAESAGAEFVGADELVEKIKGGWLDFDALVCTPDMMREVGKLGKVLGPRGLMPTPKAGTVSKDIKKAIEEIKAGRVEFKVDKAGQINGMVGKKSFAAGKLKDNLEMLLQAIQKAKPATAKGTYMQSLYLSTTMGPGLKVELTG